MLNWGSTEACPSDTNRWRNREVAGSPDGDTEYSLLRRRAWAVGLSPLPCMWKLSNGYLALGRFPLIVGSIITAMHLWLRLLVRLRSALLFGASHTAQGLYWLVSTFRTRVWAYPCAPFPGTAPLPGSLCALPL